QGAPVLGDDLDAPDSLDDEDAARAVVRRADADRVVEPVGDLDQREGGHTRYLAARPGDLITSGGNALRRCHDGRRNKTRPQKTGDARARSSHAPSLLRDADRGPRPATIDDPPPASP